MLTRFLPLVEQAPTIIKTVNGKDVSTRGAFPCGTKIEFTVDVPRALGASAVVLRIAEDGKSDRDIPLSFAEIKGASDIYRTVLDTATICNPEKENGLFYYEFLFLRGADTLFTNTWNYVDFSLERHSQGKFLLLVHTSDFSTPEWFKGRTMYHIFIDRFCRGEGEVGKRGDIVFNEDWDNGVMQFVEKQGEPLANNMFFGGNLWGIIQKLDYLKGLGVGVVYLSPIFKAYSNHKYDTGNYLEIDSMFGGEEAFSELVAEAEKRDIKIILDGVFNHTGDDSIYFDKYGNYGGVGAYSSSTSPYRNWYRFKEYPAKYESWWGIDILPRLNHTVEDCRKFFTGKGGVTEKYIKMGIGGWRLDVADELSDEFLDELRETVKAASHGEGLIIGEVWENAADKVAYSKRRRYFRGAQLDSVMNYPLRNGILALCVDKDVGLLCDVLKSLYASYPKCVCDSLMNLLGTHDTERILTLLGEGHNDISSLSGGELSKRRLSEYDRARATELQKVAATVQYTVYGVPSVFYGDEAGVEGYHDPFCRKTFPWGREDKSLLEYYRTLGKIRETYSVFTDGEFEIEYAEKAVIAYRRFNDSECVRIVVNASDESVVYDAPHIKNLLDGKVYSGTLAPRSAYIFG